MVLTLDIPPQMVTLAQVVTGETSPEAAIIAAVEAGVRYTRTKW